MNNIILNNIRINSKAIIYSFCTNLYINNLEAKNIKCIGDSGDTSFILFDSGEAENSFEIKNVIIKDSVSNGSFIKIIGNSNIVNISNSTVSNIKSYGPIIDNTSIKVITFIIITIITINTIIIIIVIIDILYFNFLFHFNYIRIILFFFVFFTINSPK